MRNWLYRWHYAATDGIRKIRRHKFWLAILLCLFISLLTLNLAQGERKPQDHWVWVDIIGEGATSICIVIWLLLVLSIRSSGLVTNLFAMGFIGIFASTFQSFLDKWLYLPSTAVWDNWVESFPMGLLALTMALWLWRKEQHQIDLNLTRRQAIYKNTFPLDSITNLSNTTHLSTQLKEAYEKGPINWKRHALILLDVVPFSYISYRHGGREAERFLMTISELITLTLRRHDVLCHLAGDRFAIVLKNVDRPHAQRLALELEALINQFRYRIEGMDDSIAVGASMTMVMAEQGSDLPETLLNKATAALSRQHDSVFSNTLS
jgi:diguanylate cyclase (GGDEF)-like protein